VASANASGVAPMVTGWSKSSDSTVGAAATA